MNKRERAEALKSGIRVIVAQHVGAGLNEIAVEMSREHESNQALVVRSGLQRILQKQIPACEEALIDHFIRLGYKDSETIGKKICTQLKERVTSGANNIVAGFRRSAAVAMKVEILQIEARMETRESAIVDRARMALAYQAAGRREVGAAALLDEIAKSPPKFIVALAVVVAAAYFGLR